MKKVHAILTSDWHLREDVPMCRTDDFWQAQWDKVIQVADLQEQFDCPVIHAGDLFHHWKPSPFLLSACINMMPDEFHTVYGQHDLPQHNHELIAKSGLHTLNTAGIVHVYEEGGHWGLNEPGTEYISPVLKKSRKVGVWHKFVWDGKNLPWPDCKESTIEDIFELLEDKEYDLIVTGDHHKPFTASRDGCLLVNPGCLTRQAADYEDHRPRVYLYDAMNNQVESHYLDITEGVVSREHIELEGIRDKRIEAFVNRLGKEWEVAASFDENLRRFLSTNRVRKAVQELVYKAIEDGKDRKY